MWQKNTVLASYSIIQPIMDFTNFILFQYAQNYVFAKLHRPNMVRFAL